MSARTALELDSDPENRPFSVVTAEVRPGSSATVVIDVTSAPRVPAYRRPPATIAVKTYQVDVVWPKDGTIEMTLFAGSLTGTRRSVSGRYEDD